MASHFFYALEALKELANKNLSQPPILFYWNPFILSIVQFISFLVIGFLFHKHAFFSLWSWSQASSSVLRFFYFFRWVRCLGAVLISGYVCSKHASQSRHYNVFFYLDCSLYSKIYTKDNSEFIYLQKRALQLFDRVNL